MAIRIQRPTSAQFNNAAQAFIAAPADSDAAFEAHHNILQLLTDSYEADGYSAKKIDLMDLESEADMLIERRRGR